MLCVHKEKIKKKKEALLVLKIPVISFASIDSTLVFWSEARDHPKQSTTPEYI